MSGLMAATAKIKRKRRKVAVKKTVRSVMVVEFNGTLKMVSEKAMKMTPAEFRDSLLAAGIIGNNGKLTARYAKDTKK